ncbi:class I SAM-dependent methyltransferase [Cupriavidus sp. BIS7]|uniref:class I SAM-dependent methyltransferase n=1 Tax=Cupriavidus sp. BIS7 TaxID=1217718 RepID=UPI0002D3D5C9|nr:class I SAM-dependent methyltransferase [Cupriavidus sp. BIS7]
MTKNLAGAIPESTLSAIPSTLRIPLAARALGDALFPRVAVGDIHAGRILAAIGDDGLRWIADRHSTFGVLARTRRFRALASEYLERWPDGHVANLGAGLSHYLQWLDNGQVHMTDADLPEVLTLRRRLVPDIHSRHVTRPLNLEHAGWWDALALPQTRAGQPVFLFSEGVFMYLRPETVRQILTTFGDRAPAGSVLAFDVMCWLAAGRARHHPSVSQTGAQFHWGPRKPAELVAAHPRLKLAGAHRVMEDYGLPYSILGPLSRLILGVPFYALYALETVD